MRSQKGSATGHIASAKENATLGKTNIMKLFVILSRSFLSDSPLSLIFTQLATGPKQPISACVFIVAKAPKPFLQA